jgi:menaquinone-specific isochorismate synthase
VEIPKSDLRHWVRYFASDKVFYFRTKGQHEEFLCLGESKTWKGLTQYRELQLNPPTGRVFGGQRFSPESVKAQEWQEWESHYYFLPQIEFNTKNCKKSYLTIHIPQELEEDKQKRELYFFEVIERLIFKTYLASWPKFYGQKDQLPKDEWQSLVDQSAREIKDGQYEKVVLSRKKVLTSHQCINPKDLLELFELQNTDSYLLYWQIAAHKAFISVTPESLFKQNSDEVAVDAIAGTVKRGGDRAEDAQLAKMLLGDKKEQQEHQLVIDGVLERLKPLCQKIGVTESFNILTVKHLLHLHSKVVATKSEHVGALDIIAKLHPTAAVGASPWQKATELIDQKEEYDRGYYSAPIGYFSKQESDFCVGIRSALVYQNQCHLYTGAGIVANSKGNREWIETQNKLKNFEHLINGEIPLGTSRPSGVQLSSMN